MRKMLVSIAAVVAVIVGGYGAGNVIAASEPDKPKTTAVLAKSQQKPVDDLIVLGNGKTAGSWSTDTQAKDMPDYMPVVLEDGTKGFAKLRDFHDGLIFPDLEPGVPTVIPEGVLEKAEYNRKHVMVQPNARGEIWVPVYAEDGETVIGKKLMDDGN